jgi:hypothetical protein
VAAFTREYEDPTWITGFLVPSAVLRNIDQKTFQSWNGDGGGSYAPSAPIVM